MTRYLRRLRQLIVGCSVCGKRTYHLSFCRYGKAWPR